MGGGVCWQHLCAGGRRPGMATRVIGAAEVGQRSKRVPCAVMLTMGDHALHFSGSGTFWCRRWKGPHRWTPDRSTVSSATSGPRRRQHAGRLWDTRSTDGGSQKVQARMPRAWHGKVNAGPGGSRPPATGTGTREITQAQTSRPRAGQEGQP